jgi:hypothetical protein
VSEGSGLDFESMDPISRRHFLKAIPCLGVGLATASSSCSKVPLAQLVALYDPSKILVAGLEQRVPFALVEDGTSELDDDAQLPVSVLFKNKVVSELTVRAHVVKHDHTAVEAKTNHDHSNLYRYFPLRTSFEVPGIYDLNVNLGRTTAPLTLQVFDRSEVKIPLPGEAMPDIVTPTDADPEPLVDNICTNVKPCGLHKHSVKQMLDLARPFVFLVATPAFCNTAYCGPVLDTLLAVKDDFPQLTFIHAEVYENSKEVKGDFGDPNIREARYIKDLKLPFEPSLFLVDKGGTIVDRIDNIYDEKELRSVLTVISPNNAAV